MTRTSDHATSTQQIFTTQEHYGFAIPDLDKNAGLTQLATLLFEQIAAHIENPNIIYTEIL